MESAPATPAATGLTFVKNLTLFYDADCGICTASVDWLVRRAAASGSELKTVAYQDPSGPTRYPMINWAHTDLGVQSLTDSGTIAQDASAIAACLRLISAWRWLGAIMDWPVLRPGFQAGYRLVARNRGHLSRWLGLQQCRVRPRTEVSPTRR